MEVNIMNSTLYGGFEGTFEEICENKRSLGEFLLNRYDEIGHKVILVDGFTGETLTGFQLKSKAIELASFLRNKYKVRAGDVIGVSSENRLEFAITIHAGFLLGAIIAPINISYVKREIKHALYISKPKIFFVTSSNYRTYHKLTKYTPFIRRVIVYADKGITLLDSKRHIHFGDIFDVDEQHTHNFDCEPRNMKKDLALIMASSGTTGLPKGVGITQYNVLIGQAQVRSSRNAQLEMPPSGEKIMFGNLPMFHAFGMNVFIGSVIQREKTVLLRHFVEDDFLRYIQMYRITSVYIVPPIMVLLAKSPKVDQYDLSSLHTVWCGAAPLAANVVHEVQKRIGFKNFREGYGMTEGTYAYLGQDDQHHTIGSVGVLLKGVRGKVVDTQTGKTLGPNESGEIHFKGDNLMSGYIGNPQATQETIDSDGWIHTGDIGYYNENGEWYVVDRIKELIKYKGFQVPPAEIEALLLEHKGIKDAGVIGQPDPRCGEKALAFVVRQPHSNLSEKDVIEFVAERVSLPKRLHGGVRFVDAIPKNPSGKILRRTLRDMVKQLKSKL